jgi:Short C-terminal domain
LHHDALSPIVAFAISTVKAQERDGALGGRAPTPSDAGVGDEDVAECGPRLNVEGRVMARMYLEGTNGAIEVTAEHVVIHRTGMARLVNKSIQIHLSDVRDIEISYPRLAHAGWITFISGRHQGVSELQAVRDPATVLFKKKSEGQFDEFRQQVLRLIAQKQVGPSAGPDFASQLRELAALRDEGLLDESEFQARKAQLMQQH